jgi:choline dehydrogenase-like flavoprotein
VELSGDADELGVPRPLVTFDFGANEKALREEAHGIGREILEAAGAVEVLVSEGNDHTMGGCRMGDDPAS